MTSEEIVVNTALNMWKQVTGRFGEGIAPLNGEQLEKQVAPGRNRLLYLVGHLTAVNDRMLPMLGLGERLHPELDEVYITNPDRALPDPMSAADLKKAWTEVNGRLTEGFESFTLEEWLKKHSAVSDEDFAKEPTRNRLAVFLSRTSHVAFHSGQAIFAK
jgi:DinB superfamily